MNSDSFKLALISCGLGHVNRGFEVSAARWQQALQNEERLDIKLFCGGRYPNSTIVWNCPRDGFVTNLLRQLKLLNDGCRLEQISFAYSFLPHLLRWQPDVIWTQEYTFGHILNFFRQKFKLHYQIIFCNGAPVAPNYYQEFDYIQHLTADSEREGREFGISAQKMQVLPHCTPQKKFIESRQIRKEFGYTESDWIVVCLAAWNRHHKRIDYLIEEIAALENPQIKLLLCGQPEAETNLLKALGAEKLGDRIQWRTLPADEVNNALYLADVFVLPSLWEGLGAVLVEAAMAGLPIVSHPHAGSRFILQDDFWMADLSQTGNLAKRLAQFKNHPPDKGRIKQLQTQVLERFSDRALAPQFYEMVQKCISLSQSTKSFSTNQSYIQTAK
jgi:glycosyltransferase involved in cell wall biosynthesis